MIGQLVHSGSRKAALAHRGRSGSMSSSSSSSSWSRHQRFSAAPFSSSSSGSTRADVVAKSSSNGNGVAKQAAVCPTPAETARTIVDIVSEGSLCSLCPDGGPLASPVMYQLDEDGQPIILVSSASAEAANLARDARVSLLVQATTFPARGVASVALQGKVEPHVVPQQQQQEQEQQEGGSSGAAAAAFKLNVDQCMYYGGLDNSGAGQAVSGDDFRAAEPDTLRRCAVDLIEAWNGDRAEDVYRIVSAHLGVPLVDMAYAELLWLDRLGMYIRSEVAPGGDEGASSGGGGPQVVRVPFYRPVLDERDARSVITMAAQIAWEGERSYVPPVLMSS